MAAPAIASSMCSFKLVWVHVLLLDSRLPQDGTSVLESQRGMSHHAVLESWRGGQLVKSFELRPGCTFSIGRLEQSDICVEHPSVSRRHASLHVASNGLTTLCDLGSAQGTFVDHTEIAAHEPRVLHDLAKLQFGGSPDSFLLKASPEIGGRGMQVPALTAEEKRALLWRGKRGGGTSTSASTSWSRAAGALEGGHARQEQFLRLTGAGKRQRADGAGMGASSAGGSTDVTSEAAQQEELFTSLERQYQQAKRGARL